MSGEHAQLILGSLQATVLPATPKQGISQVAWLKQPLSDLRLLQLCSPACSPTPPALVDAYVRGRDLVASYAEAERGSVQPHVYFRADETGGAVGLELVLSMQTSMLDSQPESLVTSELSASEIFVLDSVREQVPEPVAPSALPLDYVGTAGRAAYVVLFRLTDSLSYVEMVHPGDFVSVHLERSSSSAHQAANTAAYQLSWRLFPERLEKGVIRRCRMAGWFLPRENDQQRSADLFRRLIEQPLPLTA